MPKCGAKNKTNEHTCNNWAMPNGRCRKHGGKTPGGALSPHFRTGRYSKYLPEHLLTKYHEAQRNEDLLILRDDINLLETRINEITEKLSTGEGQAGWMELTKHWQALNLARRTGDNTGGVIALEAIGDIITKGTSDYMIWNEIVNLMQNRRKLIESERKRLIEQQQTITTEKAMVLIANLTSIIKTHVTDKETLNRISADLIRITGAAASVGSKS